jgi:hypothetical protein
MHALTRRERRLYKAIALLSACVWIAGLWFYFLAPGSAQHASLLEVCLLAMNTVVMFAFGHALRANLRIIYGVRWLLEENASDTTL